MNIDKLERANILAKSLIPKVDELLHMSKAEIILLMQFGVFQSVMKSLKLNSNNF